MTRAVLPTPATPSYCAAMTVGTMVKRFTHVRFLADCLWVQLLFTLSVPRDIFRTPALIWGRFIDSGNQVGRTRSDIQAAGPRRCQSQIVLLLLGCKAGLMSEDRVEFSLVLVSNMCRPRLSEEPTASRVLFQAVLWPRLPSGLHREVAFQL